MSSYRQILYHIIFRTKHNHPTLSLKYNRELYAYILGVMKNYNCFLYRINGMEDHIHILCDLHPSVALSDLVREIKRSSSIWLKSNPHFSNFKGWADGYAALTYSYREKDMMVNYIIGQQEHHKKVTFKDELMKLMGEHGVAIDMRFFP